MYTPVQKIRAKLARAREHINEFQKAVMALNATKPYEVRTKEDHAAQKRIWYLSKIEEIPLRVAAIAADALQNLRAAVDHIAYQSEIKGNGGIEPSHHVYFPIAKDAVNYPSLRDQYLKHSSPAVITEMNAIEPYGKGKSHGLWELNCLNISDKHKVLIAAGSFFEGVDISVDFKEMMKGFVEQKNPEANIDKLFPPLFLRPADKLLSLKVGDELFIEPLSNTLKADRRFLLDISFNHPDVLECESALSTLVRLGDLVDSLIKRFEPLLA